MMTSSELVGTPLVVFDRHAGVWLEDSGALPRSSLPLEWDAVSADASVLHAATATTGAPGPNLMPLWPIAAPPGMACLLLQPPTAGCSWRKVSRAQALEEVDAADRECLRSALSDGGLTSIGTAPVWLDPEWWPGALDWAEGVVAADTGLPVQGWVVTKPPWGGSAVLELRVEPQGARARTAGTRFFFKASAGHPAEGEVLRSLGRMLKDAPVPSLVDADEGRGCFLMRGRDGHCPTSPSEHARAVRALAELQCAQVHALEDPVWAGCSRRDGRWLAGQARVLLEEIPAALVKHAVVADSALALADRVGAALRCCDALDAAGWPLTLHHEDFRPGNVLVQDERVCILDWADTVMAHPALSLLRYLDDLEGDEKAIEAATRAFVQVWSASRPAAMILAGVEAARGVAVLYETARHAQHMDIAAWAAAHPGPQERAMAQAVIDRLLTESARW